MLQAHSSVKSKPFIRIVVMHMLEMREDGRDARSNGKLQHCSKTMTADPTRSPLPY
jgi:hypothetical protein